MADSAGDWLMTRLLDALDDLPRALDAIPRDRWSQLPPGDLSEWSAHRHLVHLANLEARAALPVLRHLQDGLPVDPRYAGTPEQRDEVLVWEHAPDARHVLDQWVEARRAIFDFVRPIPAEQRRRLVPHPAFGPTSIDWYLLRLHQHTLHHLETLLRLALWWDFHLRPKLDYDAL
jgi:hypothetical protein